MNKKEEHLDKLLDQAIMEFPLDPVPAELFEKVMARVERQIFSPGVKFSWVDLSLSALLAGFMGIFLHLVQGFSRSPYWSARIKVEFMLTWLDFKMFFLHNQNIILVSLISFVTLICLLSLLTGVYRRQVLYEEGAPA